MAELNIATFNCNGLINDNTQHNILQIVNRFHVHILYLQETYVHTRSQIDKINKSSQCNSFWSYGKVNSRCRHFNF